MADLKLPGKDAKLDGPEWAQFTKQLQKLNETKLMELAQRWQPRVAGGQDRYIYLSDLATKDGEGILQWVQLVLAGGGVLGIAHVGFVRMLEAAGIRFLGVGGASAGAINAVLIAASRTSPDKVSWLETEKVMLKMDFASFEDGKKWYKDARRMFATPTKKQQPADPQPAVIPTSGSSSSSSGSAAQAVPAPSTATEAEPGGGTPVASGSQPAPWWSLRGAYQRLSQGFGKVSRAAQQQLSQGVSKLGKAAGGTWLGLWLFTANTGASSRLPSVINKRVATMETRFGELSRELGAHPGKEFHAWMHRTLEKDMPGSPKPVTWKALRERMMLKGEHHIVEVCKWDGAELGKDVTDGLDKKMQENCPLRLVATELTTQSMVVFPRDADLFYALQEDDADPADFARASMSIPVFFKPFRLPYDSKTQDGKPVQVGRLVDAGVPSKRWRHRNGYSGPVPEEAFFCDGGMLSNFPVRLFHEDIEDEDAPQLPTIGLQLGSSMVNTKACEVSCLVQMTMSVVDTARRNMDRSFMRENVAYQGMLAVIDCEGFNWLDFTMDEPARNELMKRGMVAAAAFLARWVVSNKEGSSPAPDAGRWADYKRIRQLVKKAS